MFASLQPKRPQASISSNDKAQKASVQGASLQQVRHESDSKSLAEGDRASSSQDEHGNASPGTILAKKLGEAAA